MLESFHSTTQASSLGEQLKHLRTEPSVLALVSGTSAEYCPKHAIFSSGSRLSPHRALLLHAHSTLWSSWTAGLVKSDPKVFIHALNESGSLP